MAAAVTFAFTVPCLSTEQMQWEKFGEAHTWLLRVFNQSREEGDSFVGEQMVAFEKLADRLQVPRFWAECSRTLS